MNQCQMMGRELLMGKIQDIGTTYTWDYSMGMPTGAFGTFEDQGDRLELTTEGLVLKRGSNWKNAGITFDRTLLADNTIVTVHSVVPEPYWASAGFMIECPTANGYVFSYNNNNSGNEYYTWATINGKRTSAIPVTYYGDCFIEASYINGVYTLKNLTKNLVYSSETTLSSNVGDRLVYNQSDGGPNFTVKSITIKTW